MEKLLEDIQNQQEELIKKYAKTTDVKEKENIRKQLFVLCSRYLEVGKNIKV